MSTQKYYLGIDGGGTLAGGLNEQPGILLISGTGSACLGRNAQNVIWRAGGWGHLLDDVGSAYAFGMAAIFAATQAADGRGSPTALTKMVLDFLAVRDVDEIYSKIHYDGIPRAKVATFAIKVASLAEKDDAVAQGILVKNAEGLVKMVLTVAKRLELNSPKLVLTGGFITNAIRFRQLFLNRLGRVLRGFQLVNGSFAPIFGAVLLAYRNAHRVGAPPGFLNSLRESSIPALKLL